MKRAEIEALIDLAWQARHGGEDNMHAAISRLRALADDAPQEMLTAMNARWHDTPAPDNPWRDAVNRLCADLGISMDCATPEQMLSEAKRIIKQKAAWRHVNAEPPGQPDLAELICRYQINIGAFCVASRLSGGSYDYSRDDPASLLSAIERLVGRIEG
jgi:hypothetical protein